MARLTVTPTATPGGTAHEPGAPIEEYFLMSRPVGAPDWDLVGMARVLEDGKTSPIGFPVAVEPFVITELLPPGSHEVQLLGDRDDVVGPFSFEVIAGQYSDINIQLPSGM